MYLVANLQRTDEIAVSIHLQFVAQEQYVIVVCLVLNLDLFHIEIYNRFHRWQCHLNMNKSVLQGMLVVFPCFWFCFRLILKLQCFCWANGHIRSALRTLHWQGKRLIHCDKYGSRCQRWRSDKCIVPLPSNL